MHPRIAIIGGNGFIGKNLTYYFSEKKYEIVCIDHHRREDSLAIPNVKYLVADIHHPLELIEILKHSEIVVWLVHGSVPSTHDESLVDDFLLNVSPVIKFLEKADQLPNLEKFIYVSSGGTVYGNVTANEPISEITPHQPISNYGLSKSVAEKYIEYITQNNFFESIIFRPSNVYGPYQNLTKPQGIIGFAFRAIRDNHPLDLYDEGRVVRDFIYVTDLAEAIAKAAENKGSPGSTIYYNAGSGEGVSIKEILKKIEEISKCKVKLTHKSSRNFDCEYNVLNCDKLRTKLTWRPQTDLESGLLNVWQWIYKEKEMKN